MALEKKSTGDKEIADDEDFNENKIINSLFKEIDANVIDFFEKKYGKKPMKSDMYKAYEEYDIYFKNKLKNEYSEYYNISIDTNEQLLVINYLQVKYMTITNEIIQEALHYFDRKKEERKITEEIDTQDTINKIMGDFTPIVNLQHVLINNLVNTSSPSQSKETDMHQVTSLSDISLSPSHQSILKKSATTSITKAIHKKTLSFEDLPGYVPSVEVEKVPGKL